jgi:hypothetical protein
MDTTMSHIEVWKAEAPGKLGIVRQVQELWAVRAQAEGPGGGVPQQTNQRLDGRDHLIAQVTSYNICAIHAVCSQSYVKKYRKMQCQSGVSSKLCSSASPQTVMPWTLG